MIVNNGEVTYDIRNDKVMLNAFKASGYEVENTENLEVEEVIEDGEAE